MDNTIYYDEEIQHEANRKALLLAQVRFNAQIRPFVEGNPVRLAYARSEINRIIVETSAELGADEAYVTERFQQYVADAVAVSEPEHMDLEGGPDSLPPVKFDPAPKNPEPDAETSVLDSGTVLADEVYEPDARVDLNDDTAKASCFRCDKEFVATAKLSKVCPDCAAELQRVADVAPLLPNPAQQGMSPANPNQLVQCDYCAAKGYHFEGTPQQVQQHIQAQHQQELQQAQQGNPTQVPIAKRKTLADDSQTVDVDQGLSEQSNPVHHFDDVIQDMADRAAAIQFSTPDDQEIQEIATNYSIDPQEVKDKLYVQASFGEYTGINGSISKSEIPDGYTEVTVDGVGGQVQAHDAQVPVQLAVHKVAEDLGMKDDLVYNMLTDSYGADLGDEYHASVSGEHRYFLPADLVKNKPESAPGQLEPAAPHQQVQPQQ